MAAAGNVEARVKAQELEEAMSVLASFDEGPELVLFFKYLLVLNGEDEYRLHFNETDELNEEQRRYLRKTISAFQNMVCSSWVKQGGVVSRMLIVDSHTEGEPTRVILEGGPDLGSGPLI